MAEYSAGQITRAGQKCQLKVDDDGNWLTKVEGQEVKQSTRAKLVTEVDRILRLTKKAVHIPITVVESKNNGYISLKHGVVTGIHSASGNLLVAWDDGKNGQLTGYSLTILKRLSTEQEEKLKRLVRVAYDTANERDRFLSSNGVYKGAKGLEGQVKELLKGVGE